MGLPSASVRVTSETASAEYGALDPYLTLRPNSGTVGIATPFVFVAVVI